MKAVLHLKPAQADALIRDPVTMQPMPPEGEEKPDNNHWRRRLLRGEVAKTTAVEIDKGRKARLAAEAKVAQAEAESTAKATAAKAE